MKLNNPFFLTYWLQLLFLMQFEIFYFQRMAEIERIAYESVNVTTPFKLVTFSNRVEK